MQHIVNRCVNWIYDYWCYIITGSTLGIFTGFILYFNNIELFSPLVQACFAIILTIFTINYAILTRELVKLSSRQSFIIQKQFESHIKPKIIVYVQIHPKIVQYIMLKIKNIGGGVAYNINFIAEPDFCIPDESLNNNCDLFKKGLSYMAPNQKIEYLLTNFSEEKTRDIKRESPFSINVTYYDEDKKRYFDSYKIELYQFWGTRYIPEKPTVVVVNNNILIPIKENDSITTLDSSSP
jgi:hypothetical protein